MKRTGEPIILTVNGKAAAVVHDPDGYETYSSEKDYYETLGSIRRGLADARAGRLTEAEEFFKDFEEKHGIPHD